MNAVLSVIGIRLTAMAVVIMCMSIGNAPPAKAGAIEGNSAVYVVMPDGVRIAVELYLPHGAGVDRQVPAIVSFTRYWRAQSFDPPVTEKAAVFAGMNDAGYAAVVVDARGSGASFGVRETEFSTCETADFRRVLDWIATQPWSNGRTATIGVSYSGNTAEHAGFDPSSTLRAMVPRFTDFDAYRSILFPGGMNNVLITRNWSVGVRALDRNEVPSLDNESDNQSGPRLLGVKPVDADRDGRLLQEAVLGHHANADVDSTFGNAVFRDDLKLARRINDDCAHAVTPYQFRAAAETHLIPAFHWGSWMDAGTAAGVLARFASDNTPARYVIGAWTHGAGADADPFNPIDATVVPSVEEQYSMIFEFLAPYLLTEPPAEPGIEPVLDYYTMGQGTWKRTSQWPPAGTSQRTLFLEAGQRLGQNPPSAQEAADRYEVDFQAGTGSTTRWSTQLGGREVFYGDRAAADERLLTYTSAPLEAALEITGSPVVDLHVASTHEDGAVIAYLEAVAPNDRVVMITEGELRLLHRKVSDAAPPYPVFGPYHTFARSDGAPMPPGEVERVSFAMLPTSVEIPRGWSIRLALAGHDKDSFARVPESGIPTLSFHRTASRPSKVSLPVVRTSQSTGNEGRAAR